MGHIHLSFEYHVHKSTLKLRVWQLTDLLLPPPQISMIQSVYVRSFLTPLSGKRTFIRTEEVLVDNLEAHINVKPQEQKPLTGIQHIITPSHFKFLTPMVYQGITLDVVRDRGIQIEVCMIQKTTRKSFLIGMINIPIKKAVKKVVREKIPLIPCLNYTTPNNMRVYSATDLELDGVGDSFYSSPVLRQLSNGLPQNDATVGEVIEPDDRLIRPVKIGNIRQKNHNNNDIKAPEQENSQCDLGDPNPEESDDGDSVAEIPTSQVDELKISEEKSLSNEKYANGDSGAKIAGDKKLIKVNMENLEISDVLESANQIKVTQAGPKGADTSKMNTGQMNNGNSPKSRTKIKVSVPSDVESDGELEPELSDLNSIASPVASRPETPVWDYYDFGFEEGGKSKSKESKNSTSSNKSASSDAT